MKLQRRDFLKSLAATTACAGIPVTAVPAEAAVRSYPQLGRTDDYAEFRVIEPGRTVEKIETFVQGPIGIVRVTANDGAEGYGQISTYDADITALVLHRNLARQVLGQDAAQIDAINDRCIEANYKFPWSYVCRALAGIDTALWDRYGKVKGKPVCTLLGGQAKSMLAYGSSMKRDITPEAEAARLARLRDSHGFRAFKIRVGQVNGHDRDAAPGRTEKLVPAVRRAIGDDAKLLVDGNSGYTPPRAIEVGRLLEQNRVAHFEEPCPYWELEWTAEVAAALEVPIAGGEQDNDLAQWRRIIRMNAVDVCQPDVCYLGGFTRALRVARMAAKVGKPVVPHSANLSMVTLFTVHLLAAIPNAGPYVEFTLELEDGVNRQAREVYSPFLEVREGRVKIPDGPGWGVKINPDWLKAADYQKSERKA
jgi:L-alanine-DL-glutamate epimerase-like enolase superfamily enzyme